MAAMEDLAGRIGEVRAGEWHTITQEDINRFADVTRDRNWIHVNVDRAARGPFGGAVAHGFLTLSLTAGIGPGLDLPGDYTAVNYGLDRVRFITPVPAGSRVRAAAQLIGVSESGHGIRMEQKITVELEGSSEPACVAETVTLLIPQPRGAVRRAPSTLPDQEAGRSRWV